MADEDRIRKRFPVFDCDAHINDPDEIWSEYVEPQYRDVVRRAYWKDAHQTVLNGRTVVIGGASSDFPGYNPICIAGPQMTKQIGADSSRRRSLPSRSGTSSSAARTNRAHGSARWTSWGSTR